LQEKSGVSIMGITKRGCIGVIILIITPVLFFFFYYIGVITDVITVLEQILVAVFAVMIVSGVALIYNGWKTPSKKADKPNFDHVEAWFFYSKKFKHSLGERDPKKHVPRQKLVLVKDLKKAYYVGEYALNLVLAGKIRSWFSDDKQDNLDEWCRAKGCKLIPEEATEDKLLEPYFHAEIKNKKEKYHAREQVLFKTHFRGKLTNGFFHNEIVNSELKKFPSGRFGRLKNHDNSWATDTLSYWAKWIFIDRFFKGKLNGYVNYLSEWSWAIFEKMPKGEYRIYMRIFGENQAVIREKEETIVIV
jgi:hypothetical protein